MRSITYSTARPRSGARRSVEELSSCGSRSSGEGRRDPENAAKDAAIKLARGIGSNATFRLMPRMSKGSSGTLIHRGHDEDLWGEPSGRSTA
eukprot:3439628-Pyramimonas_sp.AAC.1